MKAAQFQQMIRRILLEEVEKRSATNKDIYQRVPEVVHGEEYKEIVPHKRDSGTKDEILQDLTKTVHAIDSSATVVWDDHDDISINARDMFRVRVIPKWENTYCIEAFTRNEDRIYVTGQTLEQVKEFIKVNMKNAVTNTQKAYDKSKDNVTGKNDKQPAPDKGLPQKDKPKTLPLTNEPSAVRTSKSKDKDYTEKQVKEEKDLPEKPMYEAGTFKTQLSHKSMSPKKLMREKTKFPQKKPNTTLTVPVSKQ